MQRRAAFAQRWLMKAVAVTKAAFKLAVKRAALEPEPAAACLEALLDGLLPLLSFRMNLTWLNKWGDEGSAWALAQLG